MGVGYTAGKGNAGQRPDPHSGILAPRFIRKVQDLFLQIRVMLDSQRNGIFQRQNRGGIEIGYQKYEQEK
jgi:hypothetical protein